MHEIGHKFIVEQRPFARQTANSAGSALESIMNDTQPTSALHGVEPMPQLLRLPAVLEVTGLGRSTVYKMIAEHAFPAPAKLAKRAVAWRGDEVRRWTSGRLPASNRPASATRKE